MIPSWILVPALFISMAAVDAVFAWNGSKFALVTLAVTVAFLAVLDGYYSHLLKNTLSGWGRSTEGWSAAQTWGLQQSTILKDALTELAEFDEEAAIIHTGRATDANLEYLKEFEDEDVAYIMRGLREEAG